MGDFTSPLIISLWVSEVGGGLLSLGVLISTIELIVLALASQLLLPLLELRLPILETLLNLFNLVVVLKLQYSSFGIVKRVVDFGLLLHSVDGIFFVLGVGSGPGLDLVLSFGEFLLR